MSTIKTDDRIDNLLDALRENRWDEALQRLKQIEGACAYNDGMRTLTHRGLSTLTHLLALATCKAMITRDASVFRLAVKTNGL